LMSQPSLAGDEREDGSYGGRLDHWREGLPKSMSGR
jgi:hypothetical protein